MTHREPSSAKPIRATQLRDRYGLKASHCLYRADGTWYHTLKRFPGILFDSSGFIQFQDHQEYMACKEMTIYLDKDQAVIPKGISKIAGYVPFSSLSV